MRSPKACFVFVLFLAYALISLAAESDTFRLLSVSESEKIILVSQDAGKAKYLLDASSAKITLNGKPAEFKSLKTVSRVQVKMERRKIDKLGIDLDGVALEIKISTEDESH